VLSPVRGQEVGDVRQKEIWQAMEADMTRKEKEKEQVTYTGGCL